MITKTFDKKLYFMGLMGFDFQSSLLLVIKKTTTLDEIHIFNKISHVDFESALDPHNENNF